MNIYDALSQDHRTFERLLDQLVTASKQGDDSWKATLDELRRGLIAHSRAEEAILYNALRAEDEETELVAHSYAEHATAEAEIRTLSVAKALDTKWTSLAEKLSKDLRHHIEEEEERVFAAARNVLSDEEADQIGLAFTQLKERMTPDGDSAAASTIDLLANLLPTNLSARFRAAESKRHQKRARPTLRG